MKCFLGSVYNTIHHLLEFLGIFSKVYGLHFQPVTDWFGCWFCVGEINNNCSWDGIERKNLLKIFSKNSSKWYIMLERTHFIYRTSMAQISPHFLSLCYPIVVLNSIISVSLYSQWKPQFWLKAPVFFYFLKTLYALWQSTDMR